jgi:hypothetical protein
MRATDGARGTVFFNRPFSVRLLPFVLAVTLSVSFADIPARKLGLIQQALTAMKLDARIQGMIDAKVEARTQKIRIDNPGLSDSLTNEVRATIAEVYAENRAGREGLDAQVYAVFDRHLTEEDLKFATNFKTSDNGKRYREVAPRIVNESVNAGQRWSDKLEPEIRRRLEDRFRNLNLKFL